MDPRRLLLELFEAALRAVAGRACVSRALRDRVLPAAVVAFAIGKAASSMYLGAVDVLGTRLTRSLVITKDGHVDPAIGAHRNVTVIESAHPMPDERSLSAGAALISAIASLQPQEFPLFLVSGGSSALVESLREGVSLADLRELNRRGMADGWHIARLNAERARLSRLKGGGVARLLAERPALALLVSDVRTDDPDIIGSGLLGAAPGHRDHVVRSVVACVGDATAAIAESAAHRGLDLRVLDGNIQGDAAREAEFFVGALRDTDADGLVWGGESTVTLPASPGRGGRNQHLALAAARALRAGEAFTILAAGTDGTDGPTEDAGAMVDAGTVARAELAGVDVELAWRRCDSGTVLEASEDLVHTGPTGTNVGDILIGIKHPARRVRDPAPPRML